MKLLIKNGHVIRWSTQQRVEQLENHHVLIEDNHVLSVTPTLPADFQPDETIDATNCAVIPGLINTHHHLYQSLTRCLKPVQNAKLFDWLLGLYEVWGRIDYEAVKLGSQISMAEMLLSGCTTTNDMFYVYPRESDVKAEAVIEAATELGMRLHAGRGSMSLGRSQGGLPPDSVVQDEGAIVKDCERVIAKFHDAKPYAMTRVDLMPCSPFSITFDLLKDTRALAKQHHVLCHTHVAETEDENKFCLEKFGKRPADYMTAANWIGPDVSWAHCVCLNSAEIKLLADTKTAVAHCPSSNMLLGSGIPPVCEMLKANATVGLGVDGSSSNNGAHVLAAARKEWRGQFYRRRRLAHRHARRRALAEPRTRTRQHRPRLRRRHCHLRPEHHRVRRRRRPGPPRRPDSLPLPPRQIRPRQRQARSQVRPASHRRSEERR